MVAAKDILFVFSFLQARLDLKSCHNIKYSQNAIPIAYNLDRPVSIFISIPIPSFISSVPNPFPRSK
jgi:hypothetical protein